MGKKLRRVESITEDSLCNAAKPLLFITNLVGTNSKSNSYKIYAVSIVVFKVVVLYVSWQYHVHQKFKNHQMNVFVHSLEVSCRSVSTLIILVSSFFDQKKFVIPIKDFTIIDINLRNLRGSMDNKSTCRSEILRIIFIGLMLFIFELFDIYAQVLLLSNELYAIIIIILDFSHNLTGVAICSVADCSFIATVSLIKKRFKEINLIIRRAEKNQQYSRTDFLEIFGTSMGDDLSRNLKIIRKQYHNLWGITRKVNENYGIHLLMAAVTSLTFITIEIWKIYYILCSDFEMKFRFIIANIGWTFFYVIRIYILAQICESTIAEAKDTAMVLQKILIEGEHGPATKNEIKDFCTQIQFEVKNFTACGFFDYNFTTVCAILGTSCTYLVILMQIGELNFNTD